MHDGMQLPLHLLHDSTPLTPSLSPSLLTDMHFPARCSMLLTLLHHAMVLHWVGLYMLSRAKHKKPAVCIYGPAGEFEVNSLNLPGSMWGLSVRQWGPSLGSFLLP